MNADDDFSWMIFYNDAVCLKSGLMCCDVFCQCRRRTAEVRGVRRLRRLTTRPVKVGTHTHTHLYYLYWLANLVPLRCCCSCVHLCKFSLRTDSLSMRPSRAACREWAVAVIGRRTIDALSCRDDVTNDTVKYRHQCRYKCATPAAAALSVCTRLNSPTTLVQT